MGIEMLSPFPELMRTAARRCLVLCLALGCLALLFLVPAPLHGEEGVTITGRLVNGTSGAEDPADLEVTLHIIGSSGEVDIVTALTDGDGGFTFHDVEVEADSTYALTASYRDILYSSRLDPSEFTGPAELLIYETTGSIEVIRVDTDALLIGGAGQDKEHLSAFEVITLVNEGDRTFVPDLDEPGKMNFLRFSLPPGAAGLDVASDLPGGRVVTVGTGFSLVVPVTPGSHQVTYTYRIPYNGSRLELDRSFPMGAETFRLLMEDGQGELRSLGLLTALEPANIEGKTYSVWGASQLSPGTRLSVELDGLPQPGGLRRLGDALENGPYLKIGIPAGVGAVLAVLLLYALVLRQPRKATAAYPGPGTTTGGDLYPDILPGPDDPQTRERHFLVGEIARLDGLFERREIAQEEYQERRQDLKSRLLRLTVALEEE
jgi:hypothetical protein